MKKVIKLTESDLTKIVKKVVNESKHDRIVHGDMAKNNKYKTYITDGFNPYYLNLNSDGDYKIFKIKNIDSDIPKTTIYFLDDHELVLLKRLLESTNNIISEYKKMIDLYRKQLIGVLEQKIMK